MSNGGSADHAPGPSGGLHISLWVVQGLLALMFVAAGAMKSTQPLEALGEAMPWVRQSPGWLVRFIGVSELAGGVGLILPSALRIAPILTPLAAGGLLVIMVLAAGMHGVNGELEALPVNVVIGGLAAFVIWGRLGRAAIPARP